MLRIGWDVLAMLAAIVVTAGFLVAQVVLRINAARFVEAFRLARADAADEPNLYDLIASRQRPGAGEPASPIDADPRPIAFRRHAS